MGRAEKRRKQKADRQYGIQRSQLNSFLQEGVEKQFNKVRDEAMEEAIHTAMLLLLVLPMEVLMDHYWIDDYAEKIPEFTDHLLTYYRMWQDGDLDMDKMKEDLWNYGGIRLEGGWR